MRRPFEAFPRDGEQLIDDRVHRIPSLALFSGRGAPPCARFRPVRVYPRKLLSRDPLGHQDVVLPEPVDVRQNTRHGVAESQIKHVRVPGGGL